MHVAGSTVPDQIGRQLLQNEEVVWWDYPVQGMMLTASDLFLVPFSLLWCGFAAYWETPAWRGGAPLPFLLFGSAFVLAGLFFVVGRFLLDLWLRRLTVYALTDRRALIARSGVWTSFEAIALDRLTEMNVVSRSNGRKTIRFGPSASMFRTTSMGRGFTGLVAALDPVPQFLGIKDVQRVFAAIQERSQVRSRQG